MFHQYNSMAGENERESWDKQEARSAREQGAWSGATGKPQGGAAGPEAHRRSK